MHFFARRADLFTNRFPAWFFSMPRIPQLRYFAAVLLACWIPTGFTAHAQNRTDVLKREATLTFLTELQGAVRVDIDSGLRRAWYRSARAIAPVGADEFLKSGAAEFGWSDTLDDLELVDDIRRSRSRHQVWQQTFEGIPVSGRTVRVNLDREDRVTMVMSAFEPVKADPSFDTRPAVTPEQAIRRAADGLASGRANRSEPELVIHQPTDPHLAWEFLVWPESEPAEYRVWVDARTGEVLAYVNQAIEKHGHPRNDEPSPVKTDGAGYVYDPDPLFLTGQPYGSPYVDADDQTNDALDAARKEVVLRDISQNGDGKWILQGPYVRIVGRNSAGTNVYDPPTMDSPDTFLFTRSDDRFEAVNAYYHIDKSQRYVQSLGITDVQDTGVDVNPMALTQDNSFYFPDQNIILFGSGGVDDAEDPSVLIHEYGHALLNGAAPGLLSTQEGRALHEGFSDYWQGSYYRYLVETGQAAFADWRWIFLWDSGEGTIWSGRYLDSDKVYPGDLCTPRGGSCGQSALYDDGMMWAATLMEVWDTLGRESTDELVLLSHYYLDAPVSFADAANAVIQADQDYFDGAHLGLLLDVFSNRGLVDASAYGPVIGHEPLLSTEMSGVDVSLTATVRPVSSEISGVELVYYGRTFPQVMTPMSPVGGSVNTYEAALTLPTEIDTVFYYLRAVDQLGNETFEPESAPAEPHTFVVGLDEDAPTLTHEPPSEVTFASWPVHIVGEARDNFGVESVQLVWSIFDPAGQVSSSGESVISRSNGPFDAVIPASLSEVENGSILQYYLVATDASASINTTRLPASGVFENTVQAGTVLRTYSFDEQHADITIIGEWEVGDPAYGMRAAPGSGPVVATRVAEAYSDQSGTSILELPAMNLARVPEVYLRFWHFYDTEVDGNPDPYDFSDAIFDGGRVEYRSASVADWTTLSSSAGYSGTIGSSRQSPIAGQLVFGGFSHGWRRASFPLPSEDGVQVRLVFGTDNGNDRGADRYAGWMIDDMIITTQVDPDSGFPELDDLPPTEGVVATDAAHPRISVRTSDDFGIQDVWMDWTWETSTGLTEGSIRMTQEPGQLAQYSVGTEFLLSPMPGDRLTYALRARDPQGNETVAGPFSIVFRLFGSYEALQSVWATGNWESLDDGWVFRMSPASDASGLVLDPRDAESNALVQTLVVEHEASFEIGSAGLIEVSDDDGQTWQDLEPEGGYPGVARLTPDSPLDDRPAFTGSFFRQQSSFDLGAFSGRQIQVRFVGATDGEGGTANHWRLFSVEFRSQTEQDAFETEPDFELQPAFPNPFSGRTRLSLSVPEPGHVVLRIHDALGREVTTLVDRVLEAGSHAFTFEAPGLPAGVYFVRLQSGSRQSVRTIVHSGR